MSNHGNYIVSLGNLCRWLGEQATELGVEIYPGFAAAEVLYDDKGAVTGVATGDMGVGKNGEPTDRFTRGMELQGQVHHHRRGRARLARQAAARQVRPRARAASRRNTASASRSCGRCAPRSTGPGSCSTRSAGRSTTAPAAARSSTTTAHNLVSVGFVVHLNYANPYLSPYGEFQRFKTHPAIRDTFEGGKRIAYGARALTEGGWQSIPRAGVPRRRARRLRGGLHERAAHQGLAQRHAVGHRRGRGGVRGDRRGPRARPARGLRERGDGRARSPATCAACATPSRSSSKFGTALGTLLSGVDMWLNTILPGIGLGYTLKHGKPDSRHARERGRCRSRSPIPSPTACSPSTG